MKKLLSLLTITALLTSQLSLAKGKIQNEDIKSEAELISAGGTKAQLPNDTKAYVTANGINDTLYNAITNGAIGGGGGAGGVELLKDTGFEAAVSPEFTNSGGTLTHVSSGPNLLIGLGSATFQASATTQSVRSALHTVPNGLFGRSCSASVLYKGGDANLKFQVVDGSANVLASQTLVASSVPTVANLAFICPSSGSIRWQVASTASSAVIAVDLAHLGENVISLVNQSTLYGTMTITGCAAPFAFATGGYSDNTQTGCVYTGTGALSAPSTGYPGFSTAFSPGEYLIQLDGAFNITSGGTMLGTRISNGTLSSRNSTKQLSNSASSVGYGHDAYTLSIPNAVATSDWRFQVNRATGTLNIDDSGSNELTFVVFKFQTHDQQTLTPATAAMSWSGTVSGNTANSSATIADFPGTGVITEETNRNMGTVTAASVSNGVTWSPIKTGLWKVCASGDVSQSAAGSVTVLLADGSNNALTPAQNNTFATGGGSSLVIQRCTTQNIASLGSPYTVKLRGAVSTGSATLSAGGAVSWTIENVDQGVSAPVIQNAVVTPYSGVWNTVDVSFSGNAGHTLACTSDPCTVNSVTGSAVTAVNRIGAGSYVVHFAAGTFSGIPVCTATCSDVANCVTASLNGPPTSSLVNILTWTSGIAPGDDAAQVHCGGPK